MSCNSDTASFCWVFILPMTSFHIHLVPTICFDQPNDIPDFHNALSIHLSILFLYTFYHIVETWPLRTSSSYTSPYTIFPPRIVACTPFSAIFSWDTSRIFSRSTTASPSFPAVNEPFLFSSAPA